MASRALIKALVAVTAIIATVKTAHAVNVELKTLILTVPGAPRRGAAECRPGSSACKTTTQRGSSSTRDKIHTRSVALLLVPAADSAVPPNAWQGSPRCRTNSEGLRPHRTIHNPIPHNPQSHPPGYNVDFMEATLDGLGAPYAALRFDQFATPRLNLTDLLWAADGTARYAAYVM